MARSIVSSGKKDIPSRFPVRTSISFSTFVDADMPKVVVVVVMPCDGATKASADGAKRLAPITRFNAAALNPIMLLFFLLLCCERVEICV